MQEILFVTAIVKEGNRQPFIALEPSSVVPASFASGQLSLTLRDGTSLEEASALAAHLRHLVIGITHTPKSQH